MNNKNKDMYLPIWVLGLGIFSFIVSAVSIVLTVFVSALFLILIAFFTVLGTAAVICHKNQWIMMTDSDSFVYSTMFGRKKQYLFSEITDLKQNADSFTLVLKNGKVHIENCAIMSDRFVDSVNRILIKNYPQRKNHSILL